MALNHLNLSLMNLFGDNLDFYIGDYVYEGRSRFGPRYQPCLQLIYLFEGWAEVRVDGEERYLEARQATLLLPGHEEFFLFGNEPRTHHGWVHVPGRQVDKGVLKACRSLPPVGPFTDEMRRLHELGWKSSLPETPSGRRLYDSIAFAIVNAYFHAVGFGDEHVTPLPVPVTKARACVDEHYAEPLDIDSLARIAGVSGAHLIRLFRKHLDTTPIAYLWQVRVREGVRLLTQTGLSISEIAYQTGFQTPFHFSRLVAREHGMPPRQLRRQRWGARE